MNNRHTLDFLHPTFLNLFSIMNFKLFLDLNPQLRNSTIFMSSFGTLDYFDRICKGRPFLKLQKVPLKKLSVIW